MTINDIIKNDKDRLFIVDLECFIIFTGENLSDSRPFIRIGTWSDLPVEIIPLIENIIITDSTTGWPSQEQFNIDIRDFHENRYIGRESSLNKFLQYQRNFGLDLTNVTAVNVEKDIPELPKHKSIAQSDHFMGIFYSDGNIKIEHKDLTIFDLNELLSDNFNFKSIHRLLSENSKSKNRYENSGFVILNNNPIFYSGNYFTSYQCQGNYFKNFSKLSIDPNNIREIMLPSENLINISPLLKLKNMNESSLKIFSDNKEQIDLIKKLYTKSNIIDDEFTGLSHNTGDGLKYESFSGTPNIKLSFKSLKNDHKINLNFIKSPKDVKKILSDKSNAILITYTAYEKSVLLFKSTNLPILIIDDGNSNISKLNDQKCTKLINEMQYDFQCCKSIEDALNTEFQENKIQKICENKDTDAIRSNLDLLLIENNIIDFFNSLSLLKIILAKTDDRNFYSELQAIYLEYAPKNKIDLIKKENYRLKVKLILCESIAIEKIENIKTATRDNLFISDSFEISELDENEFHKDQIVLSKRISSDRERLRNLINTLFSNRKDTDNPDELNRNISLLKEKIKQRKEIYNSEIFLDNGNTDFLSMQKNETTSNKSNETKSSKFESVKAEKKKIILIVLLLIIFSAIALSYIKMSDTDDAQKIILSEDDLANMKPDLTKTISIIKTNPEEMKVLKKNNVRIRAIDIYRYANDVAVKNGYTELSYKGLRDKNPHWIYPKNIFIMLDGESIHVRRGDTLWALSKTKLEKMHVMFFTIIDKIKDSDNKTEKIQLAKEASLYAYLEKQKILLSGITENIQNEKR